MTATSSARPPERRGRDTAPLAADTPKLQPHIVISAAAGALVIDYLRAITRGSRSQTCSVSFTAATARLPLRLNSIRVTEQ